MMWRRGSKPGIGTSSGNPSSAAAGASPTSSALATGAMPGDRGEHLDKRQLERQLDVRGHLRDAAGELDGDRAQPGKPLLATLADARGDRACIGERRRARRAAG